MTRADLEELGLSDAVLLSEAKRLLPGQALKPEALAEGDTGRAQVYRHGLYEQVTFLWHNAPAGEV